MSECDREALKMSRAKDVVPRGGGGGLLFLH